MGGLGTLLGTVVQHGDRTAAAADYPTSGMGSDYFHKLDDRVSGWLRGNQKPGGVLVIAHEGRLIHARGYGYADREAKRPFLPTTVFRYGSVAKWFTATALMRLVETNRLRLDQPITACRPLLPLLTDAVRGDGRLSRLTYRYLLSHKSGLSYLSSSFADWGRVNRSQPPTLDQWVRFGLEEGFKSEPGIEFDYGNFNYVLAQFLIQHVSGETLEAVLARQVFERAGVSGIEPAGMRERDRRPNESQYYGVQSRRSIWPEDGGKTVSSAYSIDLRTARGAGGYAGNALSLCRLMVEFSLDGAHPPLRRESILEMLDARSLQRPPATARGLGLNAGTDSPGAFYWGTGGMTPGMSTMLTRRADRTVYTFAFNANNDIVSDTGPLNQIVLRTLDEIREKPRWDLWSRFPAT